MVFSLYDLSILPIDFRYPKQIIDLSQSLKKAELGDWYFIESNSEAGKLAYELRHVNGMNLIPFARLLDWAAFFDGNDKTGNPKVYVFDLSDKANYIEFVDFENWLKDVDKF